MRRSLTLSATGLGLFLIALGVAYFCDLTMNTNSLTTVFRFYPILPILLGFDFLCSALPATKGRIDHPAGWVATLIIMVTIGGLVFSSLPKLIEPSFTSFRDFPFWSHPWWTHQVTVRTIHKNFQLPSGITTVRIENANGNIEINATEEKTVAASAELKISGFIRRRMQARGDEPQFDLSGEQQGDLFLIRLHQPRTFINRDHSGVAANLALTLPRGLSAQIASAAGNIKVGVVDGNLIVNEAAGRIEVERVGKNLEARNSLGEIQIGIVSGDARLRASAGRIEVAAIQGAADVESSLGEVELHDCAGPVHAKVDKGRLKVNMTGVPSDCDFEVNMGNADIGIPRQAKFSLDAATSMGHFETDFPVAVTKEMAESKAYGPVNGGGPLVKIDANMGSIQLKGI